jgi:L-ascorbate metabolism protein UlaG (beta-lactamase superfamily)
MMRTPNATAISILSALIVCSVAATIPSRAEAQMNVLETDRIPTDAGDLVIHPVEHASFVMEWNGRTIYVDPVGRRERYAGFAKAGLVLLTHTHSDHLDKATILAASDSATSIVASAAAIGELGDAAPAREIVLANGETTTWNEVEIEAVASYNTTEGRTQIHPKGVGNGYVLTLGGKRIYISGDTEDTPEMRALTGIDAAFLCMNLPYTMDVEHAADAVKAFKPKVVYPYHYRSKEKSDLARFAELVGKDSGVEVRLLKWY